MMFERATPMLIVPDVDKAAAWYVDVLGARVQHTLPRNPPFQWVSLLLDSTEIMLAAGTPARKWYSESVAVSDGPSNFIGYLYVEDAAELYDTIRSRVDVILELTDQSYGMREFAVRDPFGFVLVFAQDIS